MPDGPCRSQVTLSSFPEIAIDRTAYCEADPHASTEPHIALVAYQLDGRNRGAVIEWGGPDAGYHSRSWFTGFPDRRKYPIVANGWVSKVP